METIVLASIFGFFSPFLLLPFSFFFPQISFIFEEILKLIVILVVVNRFACNVYWKKMLIVIAFALSFALSEDVLYMINILANGQLATILFRLILTSGVHLLTSVLMFVMIVKNRNLIVVAIGTAIFIHFEYNLLIRMFFG